MDKGKKRNLSEVAADYVREQILQGKLAQREKLVENVVDLRKAGKFGRKAHWGKNKSAQQDAEENTDLSGRLLFNSHFLFFPF